MAELTEKKRNSLKSTTFGLPEERKYPMPDESHARNAKARAAQQVEEGQPDEGRGAKDRPQGRQDPQGLRFDLSIMWSGPASIGGAS